MNCKNCGKLIESWKTESELQKEKEAFTAELPFMSITDRFYRRLSIVQLTTKLASEKQGFCSTACANTFESECTDILQEQENGFNHSRGL